MTPERRDEIDRAMEVTDGTLTTASKILRCHPDTLKRWIESDDILLRKWKPEWVKEDVEDTEVHRPIQISGKERRAIALSKEDRTLKKGFRDLGFSDDEVSFLTGIAEFTNGRIDEVIDLTYGGMVRNYSKLLKIFSDTQEVLDQMLKDPSAYNEYGEKGNITYSGYKKMKEMMNALLEIAKEARATNTAAEQTMITRAKILEIKKRQQEDDKGPPKVPGFGPPEVFGNPHFTQNNHYHNEIKKADKDV